MDWVWSLWGWVWPASFDVNKFKVSLKTAIIRTNLQKLKLQEQLHREKGEVLEVIRKGKVEIARIKVEAIIQDYRKLSAYDIIVHYCDSLLTRLELLQATGDTPSEILNAIHTLAYAATNLSIPELQEVAGQLKAKYGYNIGNNQVETAAVWIDKKVVDALSVAPPSEEAINKYIQEYYGKIESGTDSPMLTKSEKSISTPNQIPEPQYHPFSTPQHPPSVHASPYTPPPFPYTPPPSSSPSVVSPPIISPPPAPLPSAPPALPTTPNQNLYPNLSTPPSHSPYSNVSPSPAHSPYPSFSPSPSLSPSPSFSPSPSHSHSSSYVDPNLLYSSPCSPIASAPFVSPPPENPEFTAHEASRAHILNMASAAARKKRSSPDSSPSPKKEFAGGIRKKTKLTKKRKSNPFQQGANKVSPIKPEGDDVHYNSSDEEFMERHNKEFVKKEKEEKIMEENKSEGEESSLDLSARLEALKRKSS